MNADGMIVLNVGVVEEFSNAKQEIIVIPNKLGYVHRA